LASFHIIHERSSKVFEHLSWTDFWFGVSRRLSNRARV
jgi:hypothetical protein